MGLYDSVVGNAAKPLSSGEAMQKRGEVFGNLPLSGGDPLFKATTGKERVVSKFFMTHPYTKRQNEVVYVSSSNVVSAAYDPTTQVMMLEFRNKNKKAGGGARYEYAGISAGQWKNFKSSASKGRFVWYVLRRQGVPYRRIR